MGIILSTDYRPQTADYQIKHINSVILQIPILLPYQIELLKWLAFYYHAPMVNCLEAMLPTLPSSQFRVHSSQTKQDFEASVNSEQRTQNQLSVNREPSTVNQTLVLVPTINRLPETMAKFPQAKNYAIYHNELKMSERFAVWQKILSGQVDFIFGSRSAIFTPCPALSKIIIFDEHDGAYKDERSPYFDTLTIAEKLQPLTGANLQIIDSAPKITTYFSHKNDMKISESKNMTTIVSMTDEKNKGNKSIVSDLLSSLILKAVARKEKTLLFLNKKRESGQFYCKTCRFHEFMPDAPQICPNCQSHDFFFNSLNIWSLAKTVKQLVPNANVNLIAEGLRYPTSDIRRPAIDIATASVFYKLIAYKYDLVAHILADTTLNIADFSALEKTFAQITNLKNLTKENGRFILQTYAQDHPVIKAAAQGNFQAYYAQSLSARKSLLYPPYALLVKLSIKGKSPEIIEKKAEKLIEDFSHFPLSTFHFPLSILGPYQPIFKTKVPTYNIILKHKLASYSISEKEKAIKNLSPYLEKISRDWQITVEPGRRSILTLPDEKLRQGSQEVTSFDRGLNKLIEDLTQTLEVQTDPPGLGLSAPQIGIFRRVFVAKIRNRIKSFINPKILRVSKGEVTFLEGCFSVPDLYGHVMRPAEIDLEVQNKNGQKTRVHYKSLPARIIQHEIDHLNGILFIDHVHSQNGKIFKVEKTKSGKEQFVEVTYA